MTFEVIIHFIKKNYIHKVDILDKFLKEKTSLNKKSITEKDNFEILK